jgi:hypothetical protein
VNSRARRIVLIVLGAVVAWYVVIVLAWATRPLDDTVPVGNLPDWEQIDRARDDPAPTPIGANVIETEEIRCNSLFADDALDGALPELPFPQAFNRTPCTLIRSNARLMFVVDTIVLAGALAGGTALLLRARRRREPELADARPFADITR